MTVHHPDGMKICCTCKIALPLSNYYKHRGRPDGLRADCRQCARTAADSWSGRAEYRAAHNKRRRSENQQHIVNYLRAHPCVDCGEADPIVLDFDHVRGVKHFTISRKLAAPWSRIQLEIEKCEVRCSNCHRKATAKRGGWMRQAILNGDVAHVFVEVEP